MDKGSVCPCYIDGSVGALVSYSHTYCLFFCNTSSLLSLALACDAPSHSIGNHSKTAVQLTSVSMTETNEHFMALLSLYDCIWRWLSTTAANIVTRESLKMVGRTNAECPGSAQPKKRHVMPACLHFHSCTDGGIVRFWLGRMQQSWCPSSNWSSILIALLVCKHWKWYLEGVPKTEKKEAKGRGTIEEGSTSHLLLIAQTVGSSPFRLFKSGQVCFSCTEWYALWRAGAVLNAPSRIYCYTEIAPETWFAVLLHEAGPDAKRGEHNWTYVQNQIVLLCGNN